MKTISLLLVTLATIVVSCSTTPKLERPNFLGVDIVIYPNGIGTNNLTHNSGCPGDYRWFCNYIKLPSQGWGYFTDTNSTDFTATITNRTDTHTTYIGSLGGGGCGGTTTTLTNHPIQPKYRFTVFGTNNPPSTTNDLPLVLHGFFP